MAVSIENITKKLGFNPLKITVSGDHEDDSQPNPFSGLSDEELECIYDTALGKPGAWKEFHGK
jgi:hypothetical protein